MLLMSNNLDDEIHPDSEFENQYTEKEVTAEEFPALKDKLYTEAPDVDISGATEQVVYKLYNDDGELLQTENVPVVKDGTSVSSVIEYYLRTETSDIPSKTASGWTTSVPVFTGDNKYLWNYEKITDTKGNELTTTEPVLLDTSGKQIESITEQYAVTTTTTAPSESDWQTEVPELTATNKYLWNREKIKYINITAEETTLEAIIGVYGDKGDTGDNAVKYYIVASNQVLKRAEDGTISPESITFNFKKVDGNSEAVSANVYARLLVDGSTVKDEYGSSLTVNTATYASASEIICQIYSDEGYSNLMDSETVEVLDEAANAVIVSLGNDSASIATNSSNKVSGNQVLEVTYTCYQGLSDISSNITSVSMSQTTRVVYDLEADYTNNKLKLYISDGTTIPESHSVVLTFTGTNLKGETVTRQKTFALSRSATGETGAQGGGYLGTVTAQPTAAGNTGDFYLDTTNQVIWYYENSAWNQDPAETPGDEWVPSWRWNAAVQDCVKNASESGLLIKAANIWVDKLVAGTALIDRIAAKTITLLTNGLIQSENFSDTSDSGFQIKANGTAIFKNDTTIKGKIQNNAMTAIPLIIESITFEGVITDIDSKYARPISEWYKDTSDGELYQEWVINAYPHLSSGHYFKITKNMNYQESPVFNDEGLPVMIYYETVIKFTFNYSNADNSEIFFYGLPISSGNCQTNQLYVDDGFLKIKTDE